jgi:hypothetical protein
MSYNIDHVEAHVLDAWMTAKDVVSLHKKLEGELAEGNFLEDMVDDATQAMLDGEPGKRIKLPNVWWYGEFSGRSFEEVFQKKIAPKIMGKVEAVCTWEGGDSTSAFSIEDGVFEDCDVEIKVRKKSNKRQRT